MRKLSIDVIKCIKSTDKSYSQLIREVYRTYGITIGKSLISYYKKTKPRIKPIDLSAISECELEWLFGLYYADGCKFIDRCYMYVISFALDEKRDKDISERVITLLRRIGLKPIAYVDKGVFRIKVLSKMLYEIFPSKSKLYEPKDVFAFVAGLIDGDGSVKEGGSSAVIVQTYQKKLMRYLMKILKLSRYEEKMIRWGKPCKKITYYVPSWVCKILIDKRYCIKLNRINRINN